MSRVGDDDPVRYQAHVITFIDILGFTALVAEDETAARVEGLLEALFEQAWVHDQRGPTPGVVNFSDTVVRFRLADSDPIVQLAAEVKVVARMQALLAQRRLPIRGAITVGGLRYGGNQPHSSHLFGPGLVRAYWLEANAARYPRIIVDPRLLQEDVVAKLQAPLRRDMDGAVFVDYLRAVAAECDDERDYLDFLRSHRAWANRGLRQWSRNPRRAEKYGWIGRYHNDLVCELRDDWLRSKGASASELTVRGRLRRGDARAS